MFKFEVSSHFIVLLFFVYLPFFFSLILWKNKLLKAFEKEKKVSKVK